MPNLNAALGCAQLNGLTTSFPKTHPRKQLRESPFPALPACGSLLRTARHESSYWLNALLIEPDYITGRDWVHRRCHERGIMTRSRLEAAEFDHSL